MPTTLIKGNKGEWSEFYALIKILTDKKVFAADKNIKLIEDKFFTVLRVIRKEAQTGLKSYDVATNENQVIIYGEENQVLGTVSLDKIKKSVVKIFDAMKAGGGKAAFSIPVATPLMKELLCTQIKASSGSKADLNLIIHDRISQILPELGFSVKSMLGAPSTLLNASGATNFLYRVENVSDDKATEANKRKVRERARVIYGSKGKLVFETVENSTFYYNLRFIDTAFPEILAELLKMYYEKKGKTIVELVDALSSNEELAEKYGLDKNIYESKVKDFLISAALGMTPNTKWNGLTNTYGGYLIVKENGDIVCYHLYNIDEFKNYLYNNTKFDTPSTTRHGFGDIHKKDGKAYVRYNLQIRFKK